VLFFVGLKLISHVEGGTLAEGDRQYGAEEMFGLYRDEVTR
jgi:hypothetical protein